MGTHADDEGVVVVGKENLVEDKSLEMEHGVDEGKKSHRNEWRVVGLVLTTKPQFRCASSKRRGNLLIKS